MSYDQTPRGHMPPNLNLRAKRSLLLAAGLMALGLLGGLATRGAESAIGFGVLFFLGLVLAVITGVAWGGARTRRAGGGSGLEP